jgi:hypothetical protein
LGAYDFLISSSFLALFFHIWITDYGWWLLIYHMLIVSSQIDDMLSMFGLVTMAVGCRMVRTAPWIFAYSFMLCSSSMSLGEYTR